MTVPRQRLRHAAKIYGLHVAACGNPLGLIMFAWACENDALESRNRQLLQSAATFVKSLRNKKPAHSMKL